MAMSNVMTAAPDEKQEEAAVDNVAQQLKDIDQHFVKSKERIERYYTKEIEDLKRRVEIKIKQFEESERATLSNTDNMKRNRYFHEHGYFPRNSLLSEEEINAAEARIAEKIELMLAKMERDIQRLERQKEYTLTVQLPYLEERMKNNLMEPKPEPATGTVTGIIFSENKQLALINHEVVKPGDVLDGVKVHAIHQDSVEFEKDNTLWKQKPGESPEDDAWK